MRKIKSLEVEIQAIIDIPYIPIITDAKNGSIGVDQNPLCIAATSLKPIPWDEQGLPSRWTLSRWVQKIHRPIAGEQYVPPRNLNHLERFNETVYSPPLPRHQAGL